MTNCSNWSREIVFTSMKVGTLINGSVSIKKIKGEREPEVRDKVKRLLQ